MILRTPRLVLRPATASDVDTLHRIWTNAAVRRYLWDDIVIPRETAEKVVAMNERDWREHGYGLWVIEDAGLPIGFAGFRSSAEDPRPELLFGLLPTYWHRGFASEAASAALEFLFAKGHAEAWGATDPPNQASVRVMERIGMTFDRRGVLDGLDTLFFRVAPPTSAAC